LRDVVELAGGHAVREHTRIQMGCDPLTNLGGETKERRDA